MLRVGILLVVFVWKCIVLKTILDFNAGDHHVQDCKSLHEGDPNDILLATVHKHEELSVFIQV